MQNEKGIQIGKENQLGLKKQEEDLGLERCYRIVECNKGNNLERRRGNGRRG
jgi:hypothetical protein